MKTQLCTGHSLKPCFPEIVPQCSSRRGGRSKTEASSPVWMEQLLRARRLVTGGKTTGTLPPMHASLKKATLSMLTLLWQRQEDYREFLAGLHSKILFQTKHHTAQPSLFLAWYDGVVLFVFLRTASLNSMSFFIPQIIKTWA